MTKAFDTIYAAIEAGVLEDAQAVLKEQWPCLQPGEWPLVQILMRSLGGGGGGTTSEGGFDAADDGKIPVFAPDGALIATNMLKVFEGPGRTDYWALDTSSITGERDQQPTDSSGIIPVLISAAPADSDAAGKPGEMYEDGDHFYFYSATAGKWRRIDATVF